MTDGAQLSGLSEQHKTMPLGVDFMSMEYNYGFWEGELFNSVNFSNINNNFPFNQL